MKHPVLGNRAWFIFWWLAWLSLAIGQSLLFYFAYGSFVNISIADSVISLLIYSGIALSLWYPFKYFNTGPKRILTIVSNLVITGVITIGLWILVTKLVMSTAFGENNYILFWDSTFVYRMASGVFIYGLIMLSYFLAETLSNLTEKNAREARLESIVKETELRLLRSQINPHFLFNSLNSISSLTITDPEKAREMIVKLSELMRYSLSRKDEQPVSLRSELENLMLYLDIEKIRFGERLVTEENIENECLDFKIPVLLLQPLFENAIKHGVYESSEPIRIITSVRRTYEHIEITVTNNFGDSPSLSKGTGTGLANVARRMELQYGKNATMKTTKENGTFKVSLYMPFS
ncbi:MAG TPA: histidine kinase [Bacteroidales bacterium]|nr:histidine kinase [Bacteroidales bacterium]